MADNYNSIFGTEEPKFISGETEVNLDNCVILKDEADVLNIEHKDIVNGYRQWSSKGKHWIFEVDVYITKHADPEASYNTLKAYEHEIVTLYRRRDGSPFINENDDEITFFIESIDEIYLKHYLYPDILRFRFISVNPVDIFIGTATLPGWSVEALTYYNLLTDPPDNETFQHIADFIDGLVTDGIYSKIDEMWLFAMNTEGNALKGMKGYKNCIAVNNPTFTAYKGFTGNGSSSYLNTNFNLRNDGISFTQNSASFGLYNRTQMSTASTTRAEGGSYTTTSTNVTVIRTYFTTSVATALVNSSGSGNAISITNSQGFFIATRTGSTYYAYKNGSGTSGTDTSQLPANNNLFLLCLNANGSPFRYSTAELAFAFVGGYLNGTEVSNFTTRLETLLDALGAGVV